MPTIDGLVSGIDTQKIIDGLLSIQQKQIDQLDALCRQLLERIGPHSGAARGSAVDEIPPHY